jgi:YHS domain-containing protein
MPSFEKYLEDTSDVCDVCLAPLDEPSTLQTEEAMGVVLTFCSPECRASFLKEPEKYLDLDDELE